MNQIYALHTLRQEIKARYEKADDHVTKVALKIQLERLTRLDNKARVFVSLSRDTKTPIRSSRVDGIVKPDKQAHWSYDDKTASETKRAEKSRTAYRQMFGTEPTAETLQAIARFGGWKKTLGTLALDYLLDIEVLEEKEMFESIFLVKLNKQNK